MKSILKEIATERKRQIECEGYTADHDDEHRFGEICEAATAYCLSANGHKVDGWMRFPWKREAYRPKNPRRDLIRAAALIVAEIERLDRCNRRK